MKLMYRANVFATKKHHIRPTLEGRIQVCSFGTPKIFRIPQSCYRGKSNIITDKV